MESEPISTVCQLLSKRGFDKMVVKIFQKNKIDGASFMELTPEDLKELRITALGDRKKICKVINECAGGLPSDIEMTDASFSSEDDKVRHI